MRSWYAMRWAMLSLAVSLMACAPVQNYPPADVPFNDHRSDEEIQAVFDRNKSQVYAVYQGFLVRYGVIEAHIIYSITIEPSGAVSQCEILKTDLANPYLGKKTCEKIRLLNFGPKNMSRITIKYPIDYLPR
ncbi:MAG TPA: AgmX/PglI C-terminal domain-containing protein [Gammaproteobacteria bacterium]|nr:AgmX/PglI C-terminal domain-containing protein [Gammaproteobacteria bacterium]